MKYFLKTVSSTFELQLFLNTCNSNDYEIQFITERHDEILIIYAV